MNLPDKCPFCGAGVRAVKDANQRWVEFKCFSMIGDVGGEFQYRSPICRHAELSAAKARVTELEARCKRLEEALSNVELVMQRPASNHRMMQIAEPARRVLNIIKQVKEYKQ